MKERLREAAATLRLLPDPDRRFRSGLRSWWPATMQTSEEEAFTVEVLRLQAQIKPEKTQVRYVPDPGAVDRMFQAFKWLLEIPSTRTRKILWMKAAGVPTRKIAREFGLSGNGVRYHANAGLKKIAESRG